MSATKQMADRFREILLNGTWVAETNYKHQLAELDWQIAVTKVGSLNTIAALTFHINYYVAGVLNVFEGGSLDIRDKFSFDAPPIESKQDWEQLLHKLWSDAEKFATCIEQLPADKLDTTFVDEKYGTYRRNIEGMIEHCYYHLGQIVLIKKLATGDKISPQ